METLCVKTLSGKKYDIEYSPTTTAGDVINKLSSIIHLYLDCQLVYDQKYIQNNMLVREINCDPSKYLILCPKQKFQKETTVDQNENNGALNDSNIMDGPLSSLTNGQPFFLMDDYDDIDYSEEEEEDCIKYQLKDEEDLKDKFIDLYSKMDEKEKKDINELQNETGLDKREAIVLYVTNKCSKEKAISLLKKMS